MWIIHPITTTGYNVQFQKKIHTHPMEGHWKFLGGAEC